MKRIVKYLLFVLLVGVVACRKDKPPVRPDATGSINAPARLLICNEGNFGLANAGITVYDPLSGSSVRDAYYSANNNQYIGDVLQSGAKFNGRYYWIVNNSGKVVVTDENFVSQAAITGFISPRYITFVSNNKAYVTNLKYSGVLTNYVQVIDLNSNTISKSIRLDGWTEEMAQSYGKVYVCNQRTKYVYVINTSNDQLTDSIFVNATNACIVKDKDEKLWVSCNADAGAGTPARLVKINPLNDSLETDISLLTTQNSISRLYINGAGNTLYYLLGDMYKMSVTASGPSSPLIPQGSRVFYGFCIDPANESIYLGDAIDYNQDGTILHYDASGSLVRSFKSGISPGFMFID